MARRSRSLFRRVLVADDFSAEASRALAVAAALAARHDGRLVALHVVAPLRPPDAAGLWLPEADAVAALTRRLATRAGRAARAAGVPFSARAVVGLASRRVVEAARDADLVVMGTRGRGGAARRVLGSVAARVVRDAPVPALTVGRRARG